jgi:TolB-like protein
VLKKIGIPLLLSILFVSLSYAQVTNTKKRIAVFDFDTVGVPKDTAKSVTEIFRTALINTQKFKVIERDALDKVLKEQKLQVGSEAIDETSAVEVGKILGVERVVLGSVTKVGGSVFTVNCRLVDVKTAESLVGKTLKYRNEDELVDTIQGLANDFAGDTKSENKADVNVQKKINNVSQAQLQEKNSINKNFSIGLIDNIHTFSLNDYKKDLEDNAKLVISNDVSILGGNGSYLVTYPESFAPGGLQVNYQVGKCIFSLKSLSVKLADKHTVNWSDSYGDTDNTIINWEFNVVDTGLGVGYVAENLILGNSKDVFGITIGQYAIQLKNTIIQSYDITNYWLYLYGYVPSWVQPSAGTNVVNQSFSDSKIYFELSWAESIYFTKSKTVSFDALVSYKMISFDKLGNYKDVKGNDLKFDFTGLNIGLGLSIWF